MLNLVIVIILIIALLYCAYLTYSLRKLKSIITNHEMFYRGSNELRELVMQSRVQAEEIHRILNSKGTGIETAISRANIILDDMKFVNKRAELIMDTLGKFIQLDNSIKRFFNDNILHEPTKLEDSQFRRTLNVTKTPENEHFSSKQVSEPLKIKDLVLKISADYD